MTPGSIMPGGIVSVARGDTARPSLEFRAIPLETVIGMTEPVGRHAEQRIEFGVRRRDDDGPRPHLGKDGAFQNRQPFRIDMFDRLDQDGTVEPGERRPVPHHRSVDEIDLRRAFSLQRPEPLAQASERHTAQIDPDDPLYLRLCHQPGEEVAVSAAEIEHGAGAAGAHGFARGFQPLFVQPGGYAAPPCPAGLCISATSLTGTSQDQPREAARCRNVFSR